MTPDPEKQFDESQVYEKIKGIIRRSKGLVFGEFSMCNIDRFKSFYAAARDAGRVMVVDTKYAFILDCLKDKVGLPDPKTDEFMRVYFKLSRSREFCEADYGRNEKGFLGNMITYREIRKSPKKFVMFTGFNKLMELVYIQPKKADYIFSSSEHFLEGEENREQREVLDNWLNHFGITLHKAHCSGHASKRDLKYAIRRIAPEILIPVHTKNAAEFRKIHDRVIIPKNGDRIEV
jgi:ribonuclease J